MSADGASSRVVKAMSSPTEFVMVCAIRKASAMVGGGLVARSDRFEVYANRHRTRGSYSVYFETVEVISSEPRKIREVPLPGTCRSNLLKVIEYLVKRQNSTPTSSTPNS